MTTTLSKTQSITRSWYQADASSMVLGRLATRIATVLMGKHKVTYTPHVDGGDFVVVINAQNLKVSGKKMEQKEYIHFSGYPGGINREKMTDVLKKSPEKIVLQAVRLMLPKTKLGRQMIRRLKVIKGDKHQYKIDQEIK